MTPLSGRSVAFGLSRRIPSSRFRSTIAASKRTPKTAADTPIKDYPPGAGQAEVASRQDLELRLEGRRLARLGGGDLLIDVLVRIDTHPASRADELTPRRWKTLLADSPMTSDVAAVTAGRLHAAAKGAA